MTLQNSLRIFLFVVQLNFIQAYSSMDLDSLQLVLVKTKVDSTSLNDYSKVFSRMDPIERDARFLIGNWLLMKSKQAGNFEVLAKTYHHFGVIYIEENNDVLATDYFTRALEVSEAHDLHHVTCRAYNSLGVMHWGFGQLDEASKYFKMAIEAGSKSSKTKGMGMIYANLGGLCVQMGFHAEDSLRKGFYYSQIGLQIAEKENDTSGIITINNAMSYIYLELGKPDSSLYVLKKNEELIRLSSNHEEFVTHYLRVGQVYNGMGDYQKALDMYYLGLSYAKKYRSAKWEYNYYTGLAQTYEEMGDYKNANKYNILYSEVHDSLVSVENFKAAADINSRYETEKKQKEILKLTKEKQLSDLEKAKDDEIKQMLRIIIGAIVLIAVLLAVLTAFLFKTNNDRKEANTRLHEKNLEIQSQSDRLSEQAKLISRYQSQMNPHFVFNALNSIQGLVINDQKEKTIRQIQHFSVLMRETLNNSEQENITLEKEVAYLKTYLAFEQEKFQNNIQFDLGLPKDYANLLVPAMMIQPFIENSIKHAALHTLAQPIIKLDVQVEGNLLRVSISDNGKGINMSENDLIKNSHAMGIVQSRLKLLFKAAEQTLPENYFTILSDPMKKPGTEIVFYLPLNYNY